MCVAHIVLFGFKRILEIGRYYDPNFTNKRETEKREREREREERSPRRI
jgi:hypothetical protein